MFRWDCENQAVQMPSRAQTPQTPSAFATAQPYQQLREQQKYFCCFNWSGRLARIGALWWLLIYLLLVFGVFC